MTHSAKDLERACPDCYRVRESKPPRPKCAQNAQLIADVRREALEDAALLCDSLEAEWLGYGTHEAGECALVAKDLAEDIRTLKVGAK